MPHFSNGTLKGSVNMTTSTATLLCDVDFILRRIEEAEVTRDLVLVKSPVTEMKYYDSDGVLKTWKVRMSLALNGNSDHLGLYLVAPEGSPEGASMLEVCMKLTSLESGKSTRRGPLQHKFDPCDPVSDELSWGWEKFLYKDRIYRETSVEIAAEIKVLSNSDVVTNEEKQPEGEVKKENLSDSGLASELTPPPKRPKIN